MGTWAIVKTRTLVGGMPTSVVSAYASLLFRHARPVVDCSVRIFAHVTVQSLTQSARKLVYDILSTIAARYQSGSFRSLNC